MSVRERLGWRAAIALHHTIEVKASETMKKESCFNTGQALRLFAYFKILIYLLKKLPADGGPSLAVCRALFEGLQSSAPNAAGNRPAGIVPQSLPITSRHSALFPRLSLSPFICLMCVCFVYKKRSLRR